MFFRICRCLASQTTSYSWFLRKTSVFTRLTRNCPLHRQFSNQSRGLPRRVLLMSKAGAALSLSPLLNPTRPSSGRTQLDHEGSNECTTSSTFLLFGWPERMLMRLALNWRTWSQFAMLQVDWVAVGACGLVGTRQLTGNLTLRTGRELQMGLS